MSRKEVSPPPAVEDGRGPHNKFACSSGQRQEPMNRRQRVVRSLGPMSKVEKSIKCTVHQEMQLANSHNKFEFNIFILKDIFLLSGQKKVLRGSKIMIVGSYFSTYPFVFSEKP
jgi:hypothetical protein